MWGPARAQQCSERLLCGGILCVLVSCYKLFALLNQWKTKIVLYCRMQHPLLDAAACARQPPLLLFMHQVALAWKTSICNKLVKLHDATGIFPYKMHFELPKVAVDPLSKCKCHLHSVSVLQATAPLHSCLLEGQTSLLLRTVAHQEAFDHLFCSVVFYSTCVLLLLPLHSSQSNGCPGFRIKQKSSSTLRTNKIYSNICFYDSELTPSEALEYSSNRARATNNLGEKKALPL